MGGATQSLDLGTSADGTLNSSFLNNTSTNGQTGKIDSKGHVGLKVVVNITAISAGSLTVIVEMFDSASNSWIAVLTSAALSGTGTTVLTVYPGVTPVANVAVSDCIPQPFRVRWSIVTGPVTATLGVHLLA